VRSLLPWNFSHRQSGEETPAPRSAPGCSIIISASERKASRFRVAVRQLYCLLAAGCRRGGSGVFGVPDIRYPGTCWAAPISGGGALTGSVAVGKAFYDARPTARSALRWSWGCHGPRADLPDDADWEEHSISCAAQIPQFVSECASPPPAPCAGRRVRTVLKEFAARAGKLQVARFLDPRAKKKQCGADCKPPAARCHRRLRSNASPRPARIGPGRRRGTDRTTPLLLSLFRSPHCADRRCAARSTA